MKLITFKLDDKKSTRIAIDPEQIISVCEISKSTSNIVLSVGDPGWSVKGDFDTIMKLIADNLNEGTESDAKKAESPPDKQHSVHL
jgi:Holliday junction resolvase RusA-like endonuclease